MTKPHSESFEQKMVQRLMGRDAVGRFAVGQGDRSPQRNLSRRLAGC
jgi:hypothetical protein